MAYLTPNIIEAILEGYQPYELTLARVWEMNMPIEWVAQRKLLGFEANRPSRQYGKRRQPDLLLPRQRMCPQSSQCGE